MDIARIKPFVLPLAIVFGILFHGFCSQLSPVIPFAVFGILVFNFAAVDLSSLRPSVLDLWLVLFQIGVSIGLYWTARFFVDDTAISDGLLVGVLCPVAASVGVVAGMLGASRVLTVTYTVVGNLMVAIVAPLIFSFMAGHSDTGFFGTLMSVFGRIAPVIGLPFFVVLFLQKTMPGVSGWLARYKDSAFYLWASALFLAIGQTMNFIFVSGRDCASTIVVLGILAVAVCILQFSVGRAIGRRFGDAVAGGQLLGQKNSAFGMWMANSYLNPVSSVFLAFYSICQNIFNSWQIYRHEKKYGHT